MPQKAVYLLVVDGYADWEPAYAVSELRRHGKYRIETVAISRDPVTSMGGMRVLPTMTIDDVDAADVAVFIVPGGDRWETAPMEDALAQLLHRLDAANVPIGAICAATTAIARVGLLKGRRHTSNGLEYLKAKVPGYSEEANYVDAPAVRDRTDHGERPRRRPVHARAVRGARRPAGIAFGAELPRRTRPRDDRRQGHIRLCDQFVINSKPNTG